MTNTITSYKQNVTRNNNLKSKLQQNLTYFCCDKATTEK